MALTTASGSTDRPTAPARQGSRPPRCPAGGEVRALGKLLLLAAACCLSVIGCDGTNNPFSRPKSVDPSESAEPRVVPPYEAGTVAEYAQLVRGGNLYVQGYGIVVGLGKDGSREIPAHLRGYLVKQLARHKLGSYRHGTRHVSPELVLRDPDTAVVMVAGAIPPGAPKGGRFDLAVTAMAQTTTRSLDGGYLMPLDLHMAAAGAALPGGPTRALGEGKGEIFVNPFVDPHSRNDAVKLRQGRVPNGGTVVKARRVQLRLRHADYALCGLIQQRINARFSRRDRVANAVNSTDILITIPPDSHDDYNHFLRLMMHVLVRVRPGESEPHARAIARAMTLPDAVHEELALVWEAIGNEVVPIVRTLYDSKSAQAAYYAARTGMRLDDHVASDVVIRFATAPDSPLQVPAILELGRHPKVHRAVRPLEKLLQDPKEQVRIAAYRALARRGDSPAIRRISVGSGRFHLDMVESDREYVIYATQLREPRIVLFGKKMAVNRPVFFLSRGELVTVHAREKEDQLTVFRKIPRTGRSSGSAKLPPQVSGLIRLLGGDPPNTAVESRKIAGLGLNYGQIVSVISQLCKERGIPAKFVLQELDAPETLPVSSIMSARPDMPGP